MGLEYNTLLVHFSNIVKKNENKKKRKRKEANNKQVDCS